MNERQMNYYDKMYKVFEDAGCLCVEREYKPAKQKWSFICVCGGFGSIVPNEFMRGHRCDDCVKDNYRKANEKIINKSIDKGKNFFEDKEDSLIEIKQEIENSGKKSLYCYYICKNNHRVRQSLSTYYRGHRCSECAKMLLSEKYRLPIEQVRDEFAKAGCELLSEEYINMDLPLIYRCSCGKEAVGYLSQMRKGIKCGCQRPRGEDNHNWNHDLTDEERALNRSYPEYVQWVKDVYERDDYTCQRCLTRGGKLEAHHILSYAKHADLRTTLSNGITLCKPCHTLFHSLYGLKKFTENNLIEYILSDDASYETEE